MDFFLVSKMFWCLLAAAAIGFSLAWWLRRISARERETELQEEINLRSERLVTLEGEIDDRDGKIMALGADLSEWQGKVVELESRLAQRDDQVMSLTMDLDGWKQQVPDLEARLSEAVNARDQLDADLRTRGNDLRERETDVSRLTADLELAHQKLADEEARFAQQSAEFSSHHTAQQQQADSLRAKLDSALAASAAEGEQLTALQADLAAVRARNEALTEEARETEQAMSELRVTVQDQAAERTSLAQQVTSLAPVAARVGSQDSSIVSLNKDLRARDTTIKGLRDELAAKSEQGEGQASELQASQRALDLLRTELDGMRGQLDSAHAQLAGASATDTEVARARARVVAADREWRSRLRIAESSRHQSQAELYRRQEHITRLERQLAAARRQSQDNRAATATPQGLLSVAVANRPAAANAANQQAARVPDTDAREWRSRLQIAESARRRAEADTQRQAERMRSLEAALRQARPQSVPGIASLSAAAPVTAADSSAATASAAEADDEPRFLAAPPPDIDDLCEIKGVGNVLQKTLNSLGIYQFRQIAAFTDQDVLWVDERLKFKGRITRDNWVEQAASLHAAKHGPASPETPTVEDD